MKDTNALAASLDAHYKAMYSVTYQPMMGATGDTMNYANIHDRTNFGQLLHKEGLWSLYKFDESRSLLYHLCRGYLGMEQENFPVESTTGQCTGCNTASPDEIRGLWTLHNFEWVQKGGFHDV